jgi:TRC40/GET3/ArsA family transport-energizing ATPase
LERSGQDALPLILVDGEVALAGRYPNRTELARWTGIAAVSAPQSQGVAAPAAAAAERRNCPCTSSISLRATFFTGKGGVGKTSIACATAVQLASEGKRVLLVSTDPASNVASVWGSIGNHITAIPAVPNLWALEIDPQAAAQAYRDRIVGPVRGVLPETVVNGIEEQLSGACTTEIAAFDEFTALLIDSTLTADYEHIIFDTAPTGHTIRLLQLPGAWSGFLEEGKGDASCLGPLAGLEKQRTQYKAAVDALADPQRTRLVLVACAQRATLREVARTTKSWPPSGCLNSTSLSMAFFQPGSRAR